MRHREVEFGMRDKRPWGDAVVTGYGTVFGRPVCVFSQDFTVFGGSLSEVFAEKICKVMDMAVKVGCPVVGINDSGGARIQEGVVSLAGYAEIFWRNVQASGVVPQISLDPRALRGRRRLLARDHRLRAHGRGDVVHVHHRPRRREDGDRRGRDAGGARRRGRARVEARASRISSPQGEEAVIEDARYLLSFLPQNNLETPPYAAPADPVDREAPELDTLVPDSPHKPYDIKRVDRRRRRRRATSSSSRPTTRRTSSAGSRGSAAMRSGSSANQPHALAGVLDIDASVKAARFVRTCDAFNIPLVTFVDVPGFLPGTEQEWGGIIRHGAKLLYAYAEATVPKLTVITRKAYGGAYDVMSSKHIRADVNVAWPTAEVAVMGPEGAVNIIFREELAEAADAGGAARRADRRLQGALREPVLGGRAWLRRRRDRAAHDAAVPDPGARDAPRASASRRRSASTGTSRCDGIARDSVPVEQDVGRRERLRDGRGVGGGARGRAREPAGAGSRFRAASARAAAVLVEALAGSRSRWRVGSAGVTTYAIMSYAVETTDHGGRRTLRARAGGSRRAGRTLRPHSSIRSCSRSAGAVCRSGRRQSRRSPTYEHYFDDLFRREAHTRSAEVEEVLGLAGDAFSGPFPSTARSSTATSSFAPRGRE